MRQRQTLAVLLCVGILLCVLPLPYVEITSGHEAREGLRLRAMLTSGDWFGAHVLRKPPLYYWLSGFIAEARGGVVDALTLRLPSGFLGILSAVLMTLAGWRAATRNGAVWAGFLLLTAPLHVQQSYSSRTDMTFSFFVSASLLVFFSIVHQDPRQERQQTGLAYLLAFLLACAFLSKGPAAVMLVAAPIVSFLIWRRDWRGFQPVLQLGPLTVLSVLTGGWCLLALWGGGEAFWRTQVMEENVTRFIGGIDRMSPLYYLGPLFSGFAPWSLLLPFALWRAVQERDHKPGPFFLALWWLSIIVFFQLAAYKRARYLLPALFPAALLVGWWVSSHLHVVAMRIHATLWEKLLRIGLSLSVSLTVITGVLLLYGTQGSGLLSRRLLEKAPGPAIAPYAEAYRAWLAAHLWLSALWLGLFSLCLGLALWLFWSRRYTQSLVSLLCGLMLVYAGLYPSWLTVIGRAASPHAYTQRLLDKIDEERAIAFINPYDEKSVPVLFALQDHLPLKDVQWPWGAPQPRLPSGYYLVTENRRKELISNAAGTWTEVLHDTDTTRWPITLFFYSAS